MVVRHVQRSEELGGLFFLPLLVSGFLRLRSDSIIRLDVLAYFLLGFYLLDFSKQLALGVVGSFHPCTIASHC